jgi:hypothetical protein
MFIKNYNRILLIIILLLFLTQYTNFFKNLRNIYLNNYETRIANMYGFCQGNSLGFLLHIKKKYNLENYPEIVNYKIVPFSKWILDLDGKSKSNKNSTTIVLLNYQDPLKANLKLVSKNFYMIPNQENNIGIKSFKVKLDGMNDSKAYDFNIKLIQSNFKNNNIIYNHDFNKIYFKNNEAVIDLDFNTNTLQDRVLRTYVQIHFKHSFLEVKDISINFFNKYKINQEKIIEKNNNCYFLKK